MATPIENSRYAGGMFDNLRGSFNNYLSTQAAIAQQAQQERRQRDLMNLKRMQELQDQTTEAQLRTNLTNLTVGAQKDIEASRATREDTRWGAAQAREDAKATEAERKANIAAVKAAYAKYRAAGGTDKIETFGAEDSADTYYKIESAMGGIVAEQTKKQYGAVANLLVNEGKAIDSMVALTPDEVSEVTMNAADDLLLNDNLKKAAEQFKSEAVKIGADNALKNVGAKNPGFVAALRSKVAARARAQQAEKAKSPDYLKNLQAYNSKVAAISAKALENPFGSAFFDAMKVAEQPAASGKDADFGNVKTEGSDAKPAPTAAPTQDNAPFVPSGYGGVMGALEGVGPKLRNLYDVTRLAAQDVMQGPAMAANIVVGGEKRLMEKEAERQAARQQIISLYNLRNPQSQLSPYLYLNR